MSIRVLNLVFDAVHITDRSEFTLLIALADESDDEGKAFPGRERLAQKSRLTERGTLKVAKRLVAKTALAIIERGGPVEYSRPNLYLLNLDWLRHGGGDDAPGNALSGDVDNPTDPEPGSPRTRVQRPRTPFREFALGFAQPYACCCF